jgi:hypothetical protein
MGSLEEFKVKQLREEERRRPAAMRGDNLDQELQDAKSDVAYRDASHPRHKEAVERANRAYDARYPGMEDAE